MNSESHQNRKKEKFAFILIHASSKVNNKKEKKKNESLFCFLQCSQKKKLHCFSWGGRGQNEILLLRNVTKIQKISHFSLTFTR